jgi:hypothetical protein
VRSLRLLVACAAMLSAAACARTYYKEFDVVPQDRAYAARTQYEDVRTYLRARGLRTVIETNSFLEVEIEPGDTLRVRLTPAPKVELTLVRTTKGSDFNAGEVRRFQETFAGRLREQTGQPVTIRLVDSRVSPIINVGSQ